MVSVTDDRGTAYRLCDTVLTSQDNRKERLFFDFKRKFPQIRKLYTAERLEMKPGVVIHRYLTGVAGGLSQGLDLNPGLVYSNTKAGRDRGQEMNARTHLQCLRLLEVMNAG